MTSGMFKLTRIFLIKSASATLEVKPLDKCVGNFLPGVLFYKDLSGFFSAGDSVLAGRKYTKVYYLNVIAGCFVKGKIPSGERIQPLSDNISYRGDSGL